MNVKREVIIVNIHVSMLLGHSDALVELDIDLIMIDTVAMVSENFTIQTICIQNLVLCKER